MADINNLKLRIKETIYPNSVGAIKAQAHQELLLEIADILDSLDPKNKYGYSRIVGSKEQYFASKESAEQYNSDPIANASLLLGEVTIPSTGGGVSEDYVNTAIANAILTTLNTEV